MKKFGLIGYPIGHSVSPAVFAAGYKDRPYSYDLIEGEDFEESWRRFFDEYDGINVTAPFKEQAFVKADIHSPECEDIGATNLLVKTPEGIKAYNSDYYGIVFSILIGCGVDVSALPATPSKEQCREALGGRLKTALVVGCGGAGKAAAAAAVNLGLRTTLMNRSIEKAFTTAARAAAAAKRDTSENSENPTYETAAASVFVRPLDDFAECFHDSDLIIYALPCPIDALRDLAAGAGFPTKNCTGESTFSLAQQPMGSASAPKVCEDRKLVIEANYRNPSFNQELIDEIKVRYPAAEFIRGNIWHLYQAWSGYIIFTGETPDMAAMAEVDK
ncbi:MAG: hypothetical protein LUC24_03480 [Bacteroidales bacterium]|nr:hypothetical protein [Bacteroidales bacterium]